MPSSTTPGGVAGPKSRPVKRPSPSATNYDLPPLPSLLTQPLGLEGWRSLEPVLLAALASEEPLLLIGPHGSAKSFLLERLARALGLKFRFYNASLINYDDLVGVPIPSSDRKRLEYISTPSAIWESEVVFFDEINRTRPELQNKLFPIVHERRVQGIPLDRLRYRWSAMNPPPAAEGAEEETDVYLGAEPLDPALADRFAYLIQVPGWQQLTDAEKRRILRDQFEGEHSFRAPLAALVDRAKFRLRALQAAPPQRLEDYLLTLLSQLEQAKLRFSARRVTMFHRNILAVHTARETLYEVAFPEIPAGVTDWSTSAVLALQNSLPQAAGGQHPDAATLLAAHRHAWSISRLDTDNPWRELLSIKDPLARCIAGVRMGEKVEDSYLSQLVLDAVAAQDDTTRRKTVSLAIYATLHQTRNLQATVFETLAQELRVILQPGKHRHSPDDCPRARYRQVEEVCGELTRESGGTSLRNRYAGNLLQGLLPDGFQKCTPRQVRNEFFAIWCGLVGEPSEQSPKEVGR